MSYVTSPAWTGVNVASNSAVAKDVTITGFRCPAGSYTARYWTIDVAEEIIREESRISGYRHATFESRVPVRQADVRIVAFQSVLEPTEWYK